MFNRLSAGLTLLNFPVSAGIWIYRRSYSEFLDVSKLSGKYICVCMLSHSSCVRLFATPWTIDYQAPLAMGFPRREYCSRLPCPSPGDLHHPGIKPTSPASPALLTFSGEPPRAWQLHWPTRFLKNSRDQYRSRGFLGQGPAWSRAVGRAGQAGTWPQVGSREEGTVDSAVTLTHPHQT